MTKHTPGPWAVDTTMALGAYGVWTDYPHPKNPGYDGVGYAAQICSVVCGKSLTSDVPISRAERDANAVLMAAAPDMLAALKAVIAASRRSSSEEKFGEAVSEVLEQIWAAIDKAEGR